MSGPLAHAITRGYHLASMPTNRARTAADWLFAAGSRLTTALGTVDADDVPLRGGHDTTAAVADTAGGVPRAQRSA